MEVSSPFRLKSNIPIPKELVIILSFKIQAIINNEFPIREVGRSSPIVVSGREVTSCCSC